jgi:hypothetical protein
MRALSAAQAPTASNPHVWGVWPARQKAHGPTAKAPFCVHARDLTREICPKAPPTAPKPASEVDAAHHRTYPPRPSVGAWRSLASALQWGCRGRRFESSRPDHFSIRCRDKIRRLSDAPEKLARCLLRLVRIALIAGDLTLMDRIVSLCRCRRSFDPLCNLSPPQAR